MKNIYILSLAVLFPFSSFAQTFNYDFSIYTSDYEELVDATLALDYVWDDPLVEIPLGFSFSFEGEIGDQIYITDFGLGGLLTMNPNAASIDLLVAYTSDLADAGNNTGEPFSTIRYKTEGNAGNQVCKIEWKDCAFYNEVFEDEFPSNLVSFQLWLYEGSNDFEIHYGPNTITEFEFVHDGWLSCGVVQDINPFGGDFGMAHVATGSSEAATITSTNDENELLNTGLTNNPVEGTVYLFGANFVSTTTLVRDADWTVFPNPTSSILTLRTGTNEIVSYSIVDLSGRLLQTGNIFSQETLDISDFETGIYLIRMTQADTVKTTQIVKQ